MGNKLRLSIFIIIGLLFNTLLFSYFSISTTLEAKKSLLNKTTKIISTIFDVGKLYLGFKYNHNWKPGIQPTQKELNEQKKLFGYNLALEYVECHNPHIKKTNHRPTLYFHGWGDTKNSAKLLKAYFDVLPGDIITFNFRDAGNIPRFFHSNFGQLPDILPALYTLHWIATKCNLNAIDLFGVSRGCAVIINLLAVLNDKTGSYDNELMHIGIHAQRKKELLHIIQNGCIVLNCPLIDIRAAVSNKLAWLLSVSQKIFLLSSLTKYKLNDLQPLQAAETLTGLNLKMLIHFQHGDAIVTNYHEAEFYQAIAQHNPHTYVVLGNDGGHIHNHTSLTNTIHTFKKKYGSSYDPEYDYKYTHFILPNKKPNDYSEQLLQPGNNADEYIQNFHNACILGTIAQ